MNASMRVLAQSLLLLAVALAPACKAAANTGNPGDYYMSPQASMTMVAQQTMPLKLKELHPKVDKNGNGLVDVRKGGSYVSKDDDPLDELYDLFSLFQQMYMRGTQGSLAIHLDKMVKDQDMYGKALPVNTVADTWIRYTYGLVSGGTDQHGNPINKAEEPKIRMPNYEDGFRGEDLRCHRCETVVRELRLAIVEAKAGKGIGRGRRKFPYNIHQESGREEMFEDVCENAFSDYGITEDVHDGTAFRRYVKTGDDFQIRATDWRSIVYKLKYLCNEITGEHYEALEAAIKATPTLKDMQREYCSSLLHECKAEDVGQVARLVALMAEFKRKAEEERHPTLINTQDESYQGFTLDGEEIIDEPDPPGSPKLQPHHGPPPTVPPQPAMRDL